jgi:hypothetical protein
VNRGVLFATERPAAAVAAQLLRRHVTIPPVAGLREWRRSLRLPVKPLVWTPSTPTDPGAWAGPQRDNALHAQALAGMGDRWMLAVAPWEAAATVHGEAMVRRIWTPVPDAAVVLRGRESEEGTLLGDLQLVLGAAERTDGRRQLAALERTVDRIAWRPRDPMARRALAARAADGIDVDVVKRQELRAAVYLVLAERDRPQAHRFGRSWTTGDDGRLVEVVPAQLDENLHWGWFCDEVRKAADASLLGQPYPAAAAQLRSQAADSEEAGEQRVDVVRPGPRGLRSLTRADSLDADVVADPSPGPLDLLLTKETAEAHRRLWRRTLDAASPRQRQLLDALAAGSSADDYPVASLADAARLVGVAPSTAGVQWKRLVDRARRSASERAADQAAEPAAEQDEL